MKKSIKYLDIKEAQKDPNFIRDINKFIKATTKIYKLKSKRII